jgi:hypothetical protein
MGSRAPSTIGQVGDIRQGNVWRNFINNHNVNQRE